MDERTALDVTAVRAVETADGGAPLWTDADRAWASRAAAEVVGEARAPATFVARRATLALERLGARNAAAARRRRAALAAVGRRGDRRRRVRARRRRRSHRRRATDQRARSAGVRAARVEPRRVCGTRRRVRRALRRTASGRSARGRARSAAAFARSGARSRGRRNRCRTAASRRSPHCLRLGAPRGPALRGARRAHPASRRRGAGARRHRGAVRARPRVRVPRDMGEHVPRRERGAVDGRGRARAGRVADRAPVPDVAQVAAIRAPASENAALWLHLMAATLAVVVVPRLVARPVAGLVERHRATHLPVPLAEPYFQRLLRGFRGGPARVACLRTATRRCPPRDDWTRSDRRARASAAAPRSSSPRRSPTATRTRLRRARGPGPRGRALQRDGDTGARGARRVPGGAGQGRDTARRLLALVDESAFRARWPATMRASRERRATVARLRWRRRVRRSSSSTSPTPDLAAAEAALDAALDAREGTPA